MSKRVSMALVLGLVVSAALAAQTTQPKQQPTETKSLGVSLAMPDGHFVAYPVQPAGADEEKLSPIPITGYNNVAGLRIYPYMAGEQVGVRVTAMLTDKPATPAAGPATPAAGHAHQLVGSYIIGKEGDSLQLADLGKFGLPPLAVKVVRAAFSEDPADPCCCTNDGLNCCGRTWAQMCAICAGVCPTCGALKKQQQDAEASHKPKTEHQHPILKNSN
jgi:hypothetical protein